MYIDMVLTLLAMHSSIVFMYGNSAHKKDWYEQGNQPLCKRMTQKFKPIY